MNKAIITGRWVKDPETRYTQDGKAVAKGTIAVNRRGDGADFISVVGFGKTAEFIEKYFKKGMKADICGHIQTGSYENKDGQKVYTTDVVIEEIEFGESKKESNTDSKADEGFIDVRDTEQLPFN